MALKIPPAIVFLACGGIMCGINYILIGGWLHFPRIYWLVFTFVLFGAILAFGALAEFIRHRTSIDPHKPDKSSSLVTGSVYRFSRNPMYLSLTMWLAALGFYLGNLLSFLALPLFTWYITRFQIKPEERILHQKYGAAYWDYKSRVRRWL